MLNISKDRVGGLIFLFFSIAYGYYARQVLLMPGDISQAFNAQTLPNALSIAGVVLSIALLVTAKTGFENRIDLVGYQFSLVLKLLVLIVAFAIILKWLGFILSTIVFLVGGFWALGEKSIKRMLIVAIPFAICTWFILAKLLEVYLAPGVLFTIFSGS
ncbi:MAG: tripartite tricarboxylate transporter TctB family protein [Cellvibrionaceae bacterium]